jgi:outer membrane protein OmpA-like peptidoglycan-associated protein
MFRALLVLGLAVISAVNANAISGKGTTAATFLKIGVGPRAVAMGETFAGIADDPSAVYWNPSGISQVTTPAFTAMHAFWLQDVFFDHLGATFPLSKGTGGLSLVYLNDGELLRSEEGDTPDSPFRGTFSASNLGLTAAYAYPYDESLSLGTALKFFTETIDGAGTVGWALDLSVLYRMPWKDWKLGGAVQNLGPSTHLEDSYARLPINLKVGVSYQILPRLLAAMDYNQLLEQDGKLSLGLEYLFERTLALRLGYRYQSAIDNGEYYEGYGTNALAGVSAGVGINYQAFRLDYAFVPYGFLGNTHRVSLSYVLPPPATPTPTPRPTPMPTPAPTPAPTVAPEVKAQVQEVEQKIAAVTKKIALGQLAKIQFASGKADLTPASLKTLRVVAKEFRPYPEVVIRIEGHTDAQGVADDNLKLSQRRVDAVKAYLVEKEGLLSDHLQAIGYGQTRPIASNATKAGRGQNRRVEFKVVNQEE